MGVTDVTFTWTLPEVTHRNGQITGFTLSCYFDSGSLAIQRTFVVPGTYSVLGFNPGTSYTCSLVAFNSKGDSPPAVIPLTTQTESTPESKCNTSSLSLLSDPLYKATPHYKGHFLKVHRGSIVCIDKEWKELESVVKIIYSFFRTTGFNIIPVVAGVVAVVFIIAITVMVIVVIVFVARRRRHKTVNLNRGAR